MESFSRTLCIVTLILSAMVASSYQVHLANSNTECGKFGPKPEPEELNITTVDGVDFSGYFIFPEIDPVNKYYTPTIEKAVLATVDKDINRLSV